MYHIWYVSLLFKDFFSPLKYDSTMKYAPKKYFLKIPMAHITEAASPTKLCLEFSNDDTVDLKMK